MRVHVHSCVGTWQSQGHKREQAPRPEEVHVHIHVYIYHVCSYSARSMCVCTLPSVWLPLQTAAIVRAKLEELRARKARVEQLMAIMNRLKTETGTHTK